MLAPRALHTGQMILHAYVNGSTFHPFMHPREPQGLPASALLVFRVSLSPSSSIFSCHRAGFKGLHVIFNLRLDVHMCYNGAASSRSPARSSIWMLHHQLHSSRGVTERSWIQLLNPFDTHISCILVNRSYSFLDCYCRQLITLHHPYLPTSTSS